MSLKWRITILRKRIYMSRYSRAINRVSDEEYTKALYRIVFGEELRLNPPVTYNEHLCRLKIDDDGKSLAKYADKYAVREYIESTIGKEYLNTVYGIFNSFDQIDFDALPKAFALKGTHGSSFNIIVPDKTKLNLEEARKKFERWLSEDYYFWQRERPYHFIQPRIMCDAYLEPADHSMLNEIKLFCINGRVRFITDNHEKDGKRFSNIYDPAWNLQPVTYGFPNNEIIPPPQNKKLLIELAEKLAAPFKFVRVDLYNVDGRIYFSELTFYPGGGLLPFSKIAFDEAMGKYFDL